MGLDKSFGARAAWQKLTKGKDKKNDFSEIVTIGQEETPQLRTQPFCG